MENNQTVNLIMEKIPTDISGKWIAVNEVRKVIYNIIQPTSSPYQSIKENVE